MESKNQDVPTNIEDLMKKYITHEKGDKAKDYNADLSQYKALKTNPITPWHQMYYYTKYKTRLYLISNLFLLFSIGFYLLYFGGFILEAYIFRIGIAHELIIRLITFSLSTGYVFVFVAIFHNKFNKWNWVWYAAISTILITIIFSALATINVFVATGETFFNALYTISGLSLGPACLIFYLTYKFHSYITDYGGIHLFLGWIYRISETNGNLKALHLSFEKLMLDLDSWLINTLKLIVKNRVEIIEKFSLNIIYVEDFIKNISIKFKDDFDNIFKGLLVDEILSSDNFSKVDIESKKISKLDKFHLKYLNSLIAGNQLSKIIKLIEKLSSKRLKVLFYSSTKRISKSLSKIILSVIPIIGALLPLIFQLFL